MYNLFQYKQLHWYNAAEHYTRDFFQQANTSVTSPYLEQETQMMELWTQGHLQLLTLPAS